MTDYIVSAGQTGRGITLSNGDSENVLSGGAALATTVSGGGLVTISSGGLASDTAMVETANLIVFVGGSAFGAIVKQQRHPGSLVGEYVSSGGFASASVLNADRFRGRCCGTSLAGLLTTGGGDAHLPAGATGR